MSSIVSSFSCANATDEQANSNTNADANRLFQRRTIISPISNSDTRQAARGRGALRAPQKFFACREEFGELTRAFSQNHAHLSSQRHLTAPRREAYKRP